MQAAPTDIYLRILDDVASKDGGVTLAWLIFGVVVLLPVLAARRLLSKHHAAEYAEAQTRQTLFRIVVGLLYPGILGSIFFELLPDLVKVSLNAATLPLIVLEFAIIGHFCYDFIFISANYSEKAIRYRVREYAIDLVVILLLYLSATAVDLDAKTADVAKIGALFSLLYLLFTIWDFCRGESWRTRAIDLGMMFLYLVFTEASNALQNGLGAATPLILAAIIVMDSIILSGTTAGLEKPAAKKHKHPAA